MDPYVCAFNRVLQDALQLIYEKFPDDPSVKHARTKIAVAVDACPSAPLTTFMEHTIPFAKQIDDRDDAFFLGRYEGDDELQVLNLKDRWNALDANTKNGLWERVNKLKDIGSAYCRARLQ
jgi:hypothetical protein